MEPNKTESVRVDREVLNKVRQVVKSTKQSIGGFISLEIEKVADRKLKTKKQSSPPPSMWQKCQKKIMLWKI